MLLFADEWPLINNGHQLSWHRRYVLYVLEQQLPLLLIIFIVIVFMSMTILATHYLHEGSPVCIWTLMLIQKRLVILRELIWRKGEYLAGALCWAKIKCF